MHGDDVRVLQQSRDRSLGTEALDLSRIRAVAPQRLDRHLATEWQLIGLVNLTFASAAEEMTALISQSDTVAGLKIVGRAEVDCDGYVASNSGAFKVLSLGDDGARLSLVMRFCAFS